MATMTWNGDQLFASKKHDWQTPQHVFKYFDSLYKYQLDAAATADNAKCEQYITPEEDALSIEWDVAYPEVKSVWLNPPYGRGLGDWMKKCHDEARKGKIVTALIMARTDTRWWHDWCMKASLVYLIKGRIRFVGSDGVPGNSAPAPSALVVWEWWEVFGPTFRGCEIPK
jgi:phage N-6-adenine-methyltransferase